MLGLGHGKGRGRGFYESFRSNTIADCNWRSGKLQAFQTNLQIAPELIACFLDAHEIPCELPTGSSAPDLAGVKFSRFDQLVLSATGGVAVLAGVSGTGVTDANNLGI